MQAAANPSLCRNGARYVLMRLPPNVASALLAPASSQQPRLEIHTHSTTPRLQLTPALSIRFAVRAKRGAARCRARLGPTAVAGSLLSGFRAREAGRFTSRVLTFVVFDATSSHHERRGLHPVMPVDGVLVLRTCSAAKGARVYLSRMPTGEHGNPARRRDAVGPSRKASSPREPTSHPFRERRGKSPPLTGDDRGYAFTLQEQGDEIVILHLAQLSQWRNMAARRSTHKGSLSPAAPRSPVRGRRRAFRNETRARTINVNQRSPPFPGRFHGRLVPYPSGNVLAASETHRR